MQTCKPPGKPKIPPSINISECLDCKQASSGLAGLGADTPSTDPAVLNPAGFAGYDDLVKAKGILDLIVKLPSFDAELGKARLFCRNRAAACGSV